MQKLGRGNGFEAAGAVLMPAAHASADNALIRGVMRRYAQHAKANSIDVAEQFRNISARAAQLGGAELKRIGGSLMSSVQSMTPDIDMQCHTLGRRPGAGNRGAGAAARVVVDGRQRHQRRRLAHRRMARVSAPHHTRVG